MRNLHWFRRLFIKETKPYCFKILIYYLGKPGTKHYMTSHNYCLADALDNVKNLLYVENSDKFKQGKVIKQGDDYYVAFFEKNSLYAQRF